MKISFLGLDLPQGKVKYKDEKAKLIDEIGDALKKGGI